jgi:hypothetical protein
MARYQHPEIDRAMNAGRAAGLVDGVISLPAMWFAT